MPRLSFAIAFACLALPAGAENFTTAAEVKPILAATKPGWIAVREFDGHDLLYFTNILAWRCGISKISYGLNGAAPETDFAMEPCHEADAQPNALIAEDMPIFVTLDLASVRTVTVKVTFDDGSEDQGEYERAAVMTP